MRGELKNVPLPTALRNRLRLVIVLIRFRLLRVGFGALFGFRLRLGCLGLGRRLLNHCWLGHSLLCNSRLVLRSLVFALTLAVGALLLLAGRLVRLVVNFGTRI